jgi:hypothetical protein
MYAAIVKNAPSNVVQMIDFCKNSKKNNKHSFLHRCSQKSNRVKKTQQIFALKTRCKLKINLKPAKKLH